MWEGERREKRKGMNRKGIIIIIIMEKGRMGKEKKEHLVLLCGFCVWVFIN